MEFKGTKDLKKWTYEYDGDGMRFNGISVYVDDCYEKYREDAQLISKAPEMLQLLKDTYLHIDALSRKMKDPTYSQGMKGRAEKIKQLIKSATELS